ncbi:hypothetical protein EDF19_0142 [Curtobacterium sp. PhB115]|nr:hypothetical protein EDF19_0142 [Curtobacterium sp. PhB115]
MRRRDTPIDPRNGADREDFARLAGCSPHSQCVINNGKRPGRNETVRPVLAQKIDAAIEKYMPDKNRLAFETVGPFVREIVRMAEPTTYDNARRLLSMVCGITIWQWMRSGCELTPERILSDNLIAKYVDTVLINHSPSYRFDTTRILGTLATKLTGERTHRLTLPAAPPLAPYTSAELAELNSWRLGLPTSLAKRNAATLLSLGAGAGLTPAEIITARREDVSVVGDDDRVIAVRGDRARSVPVRREWVRVLDLARTTDESLLFHGYDFEEYPARPIASFISAHPAKVQPTLTRLRSGWIANLIDANIPDGLIAELAGVDVVTVARYYPYARQATLEAHFDAVTGIQAVTR